MKRLSIILVSLVLIAGSLPALAQASTADEFAKRETDLATAAAQTQSLADQLKVLDDSAALKTATIADVSRKAAAARRELAGINTELTALQRKRVTAQRRLAGYARLDYMGFVPNEYSVIASDNSLTDNLAVTAYLGNYQATAAKSLTTLTQASDQIAAKRKIVLATYGRLDELDAESQQDSADLAAVRQAKQRLLAQTEGNENVFRAQFEALRKQLEETGAFARSARDRIKSRVWDDSGYYFNQLDSRWIDGRLGFSQSSTIGDYGCGLASLAMVYKYYGIQTDPTDLNTKLKNTGAFVDDLLDWRNAPAASGGALTLVNSPYPVGQVDWNLINSQLDSGNPVIVYLRRLGQQSHYVVLTRRSGTGYLMHDPIEGPFLRFGDHYRTDQVYQFVTFRRT